MTRRRTLPARIVTTPRPADHSWAGFLAILERVEQRVRDRAASKARPEEAIPCAT